MAIEFDPMKHARAPERRPVGQFVISWDPNTGQLGYNSQGLLPVEEIGLLQWMINLRMGAHLKVLPNNQVQIASPADLGRIS